MSTKENGSEFNFALTVNHVHGKASTIVGFGFEACICFLLKACKLNCWIFAK
jgi:hypothetical protein